MTDALGRVVEHVRVGDGGDYIWNGSIYEDGGFPDGRTKTTRLDDRGEGTTTTHATITHRDFAGRPFILQNPGGTVAPASSQKHQKMSLFAEYDGASRLKALYDGDFGRTDFFRDGPGRVILRRLVNGNGSADLISQYNTRDIIERDALGRIAGTEYWGTETGGFMYGEEEFQRDSVGRVHSERFRSVFAPQHWLINNSTYVGPNPYRSGLSYTDTLAGAPSSFEKASLSMTHDSIGRLTEIGWDRAPGAGGAMAMLAKYDYAGGMKRKREVRFGSSGAGPRSHSDFHYDRFDRLLRIADTVHAQTGSVYTGSFDYEYDEVHNLTKERYTKVEGAVGDRFSYDPYHRLRTAKIGCNDVAMDDLTSGQAVVHEQLTYGLDGVNNRTTVTTQQGSTTSTATYRLQDAAHPQGASNRYDALSFSGTLSRTLFKYDNRGNLTYDGRFQYRYDYLNRLQEVWKVTPAVPVNDDAMFAEVESGAVDDAEDAIKLEVPDIHTRVFREHTNPAFRSRLRATIVGGVITVTPTPQGGGGRPGFLPNPAQLELVAVYVYDAFNRRVAAALVDPTLSDPAVPETQFHVWDGWRQVAQHRLDTATWQAPVMKQFVWGNGLDELVSYRRRVGPAGPWQTYFLLHGGQDTSAKLVDDAGVVVEQYEYDAYGRAKCFSRVSGVWTAFPASQFGMPFLWKGIRLDEITGLLQMRNRHYSVDSGRFLSVDPIGVWGDRLNHGNEYDYVGCRPLSHGDAMGLQGEYGQMPGPDMPLSGLLGQPGIPLFPMLDTVVHHYYLKSGSDGGTQEIVLESLVSDAYINYIKRTIVATPPRIMVTPNLCGFGFSVYWRTDVTEEVWTRRVATWLYEKYLAGEADRIESRWARLTSGLGIIAEGAAVGVGAGIESQVRRTVAPYGPVRALGRAVTGLLAGGLLFDTAVEYVGLKWSTAELRKTVEDSLRTRNAHYKHHHAHFEFVFSCNF